MRRSKVVHDLQGMCVGEVWGILLHVGQCGNVMVVSVLWMVYLWLVVHIADNMLGGWVVVCVEGGIGRLWMY